MKATLEFDLPEDREEHTNAVNGTAWKCLVFDFDQTLRSWLKHGQPGDKAAGLQAARDSLRETIQEAGLSLD
jgi:hypothetical protein